MNMGYGDGFCRRVGRQLVVSSERFVESQANVKKARGKQPIPTAYVGVVFEDEWCASGF